MTSPSANPHKRATSASDGELSDSGRPLKQRRVSTTNAKSKTSAGNHATSRGTSKETQGKASSSLASWLKIPPPPPLPEPFFVTKPIFDRDSIFIGYALPLAEPSVTTVNSYIARLPHDHPDLPDVVAGRGGSTESNGSAPARKKIKPNHNMWAYKCLRKKPGTSGTSEADYEPVEASSDDGEQYGGAHLLKVLNEEGTVDVLVICSRWFGGTMLGPIRFQHIEKCARAALEGWTEREKLVELWREIDKLDAVIEDLRIELAPPVIDDQPSVEGDGRSATPKADPPAKPTVSKKHEAITNIQQLERLVKARTMTVQTLINKVTLQKP